MGYGLETFSLLKMLAHEGLLPKVKRVIDLGSQEIHFSKSDRENHHSRSIIREFILTLGGPDLPNEELDALANRASVGELFKILDIEYKPLDSNGWYGDPFDFNLDKVSHGDSAAYCLTINSGTTEHLLDQENAFRIAHDLTRVGGLMIHSVPFIGFIDHGFFNYNPNLFSQMALSNSYELIGMWVSAGGSLFEWNEYSAKNFSYLGYLSLSGGGLLLNCVFKKAYEGDYCIPFQQGYDAMIDSRILERYQVNVDGQLLDGVESRQILEQDNLRYVSGKTLARELVKRLIRKIRSG